MKKLIFIIIVAYIFFATELASAKCFSNYPYNGEYVTYCIGNDYNEEAQWGNNYYYSNSYNNYPYSYYDYYNNYYNNYYYRSEDRTDEENYYNMLYINDLGGPGEEEQKDDYFTSNSITKDTELEKLNSIQLEYIIFYNSKNKDKYLSSKKFVESLKEEVKTRYLENRITYYQMNDVINDLENLVFSLNEQYKNLLKYENTGRDFYLKLSQRNSDDVKINYGKLKFTLKKING